MKHKKLLALLIVPIIAAAFLLYFSFGYHATENAVESLESTDFVTVEKNDGYIAFIPDKYDKGLIFYQGAKVNEEAYAPLMMSIAENDILCVLAQMPFDFAFFGMNSADRPMGDFSSVESWYICGHSLGGAVASMYAHDNSDRISGVILLGSYSTEDLAEKELDVLSVYGSEDMVLARDKYDSCRSNLPQEFTEYVIDGGNHAYFGSYGEQNGDGTASITSEKQTELTAKYITEFINNGG